MKSFILHTYRIGYLLLYRKVLHRLSIYTVAHSEFLLSTLRFRYTTYSVCSVYFYAACGLCGGRCIEV